MRLSPTFVDAMLPLCALLISSMDRTAHMAATTSVLPTPPLPSSSTSSVIHQWQSDRSRDMAAMALSRPNLLIQYALTASSSFGENNDQLCMSRSRLQLLRLTAGYPPGLYLPLFLCFSSPYYLFCLLTLPFFNR
jgi:hypothetical protein